MEKYDFIKLMLKSRNLSVNDKKRLVLLATKEIENTDRIAKEDETKSPKGAEPTVKEQVHAPKDTAAFLSLFNREDGFKFLTHDFDPESEMEYSQLVKLARDTFMSAKEKYDIPKSLYALMYTMLYGGKKDGKDRTWMDSNRKFHSENFACKKWTQWAQENPKIHILTNESFKKVLMAFRSTIRVVQSSSESDSRLETIIKRQSKKHADLSITSDCLEDADFYTYVHYLEKGITFILNDMSKYSKESPKIKISFESSLNGDYKLCVIKITQYGSFSTKSLDEVKSKFHDGGGDFFSIKNILCGYCNWTVESKWGDKDMRWNILDDTGKDETEELPSADIPGFTHILTYYSKLK